MGETRWGSLAQDLRRGLLIGSAVLVGITPQPIDPPATAAIAAAVTTQSADRAAVLAVRLADFRGEPAGADARELADWIADTRDNAGLAFFIVDKKGAALLAFDGEARLLGASPVLLGAARGDDSAADIGTRPIERVKPHERTTPSGRYLAERGRNAHGEDVIWVDYDAALSMHRVRVVDPKQRRLERLATPTIDDNRISYGCINVPVAFYEAFVRPPFVERRALVYVLPEVKALQQVFGIQPARHASLEVSR